MRLPFNLFSLFLFLVIGHVCAAPEQSHLQAQLFLTCPVRETAQRGHSLWWTLSCDGGFLLIDDTRCKRKKLSDTSLFIIARDGTIKINGAQLSNHVLFVEPLSLPMRINGMPYAGSARIEAGEYETTVTVYGGKTDEKKIAALWVATWEHVLDEKSPFHAVPKEKKSWWGGRQRQKKQQLNQLQDLQCVDTGLVLDVPQKTSKVRVLLDNLKPAQKWKLHAPDGFVLWYPDEPKLKIQNKNADVVIEQRKGNLYCNNTKIKHDTAYLTPCSGQTCWQGKTYSGALIITKDKNKHLLVNMLDLEEYVYCVLKTESWPGWPLEVNKAFAITSRSYAIATAMQAQKLKRPYHIKNTNEHQTYGGSHSSSILKQAVDQTKGVFLTYDKKPILAMFDSCCGGVVPAHVSDVNFNHAPYLARPYACNHCRKCRLYAWKAEYDVKDFEERMKKHTQELFGIREVKVTKKDKAGLVREVLCKGKSGWHTLSGQKMYSLMKEVKSFYFGVRKKGSKVIFTGRGYGHHLGLCQWGAREMVRDGWHYKRILQFYYPGTDFVRLT